MNYLLQHCSQGLAKSEQQNSWIISMGSQLHVSLNHHSVLAHIYSEEGLFIIYDPRNYLLRYRVDLDD